MIEGLHELGYTEGQNVVFERRFGESNSDQDGNRQRGKLSR